MAVALVTNLEHAVSLPTSPNSGTQTIGAASTILLVPLAWGVTSAGLPSGVSVTWNGVSMSQLGSTLTTSDNLSSLYLFGLDNPATGAHTLSISFTAGGGANFSLYFGLVTFSGNDLSSLANAVPSANILTDTSTPAGAVYPTSAFSVVTANGDAAVAFMNATGAQFSTMNIGTLLNTDGTLTNNFTDGYSLAVGASTSLQFGSGASTPCVGIAVRVQQPVATGLASFGWWRREFEGLPIKPTSLELPPARGIPKLAVPPALALVFNAPHDFNPFAQGRSEPTAKPFALTIPIANPIIYWREHDNIPFAKGRDDPGARGTSLTIPLAAPIIPRTSHDLNPFAQGKDEPPRMRILPLPTPGPVLLAPQIFNPFPPGKDDPGARGPAIQLPLANPVIFWREHNNVQFAKGLDDPGARGKALTIPTVPPVYNAPHDFNPFAFGRSEPPAIGWPKITIAVLAAEVFNAPHDFNPFAQGKSEPAAWRILSLPTPRPVYNPPHDQNPYPQGVTLPLAWRVQILPTPSPVLNAAQIFNPFAAGRTDPPAWSVPPFPPVALRAVFNPPHDFNPFAVGRSEAPAIGLPKLVIPVLAPIVFNAPAIHTPYPEGRSVAPTWILGQLLPASLLAQYILRVDHYIKDVYIPVDTLVTEGKELPIGWIPTPAAEPINTPAIQAYWNAGPFGVSSAQYSLDFFNSPFWQFPKVKMKVYWVEVGGQPGYFQLTGAGASLGAKRSG